MEKNFLLDVGITNEKVNDILQYIVTGLQKPQKPYYVVTPNPEFLVYATHHPEFRTILNQARLALPDGVGVLWAGKILGKTFKQRITGADFMELLCKEVVEKPITVGFLGGGPKVAEKTAECLKAKYPSLKVVFTGQEWPKSTIRHSGEGASSDRLQNLKRTDPSLARMTNGGSSNDKNKLPATIDILFVAYGAPKQEEWMAQHVGKIPVKVFMGVGGSFDYISGNVSRAPKFLRSIGLEWLYRLLMQPWRIKRQLALLEFIYLVLKQRLSLQGLTLRG